MLERACVSKTRKAIFDTFLVHLRLAVFCMRLIDPFELLRSPALVLQHDAPFEGCVSQLDTYVHCDVVQCGAVWCEGEGRREGGSRVE